MKLFDRSGGVPAEVLSRAELPRGEKALAWAQSVDGTWLLGTRRSLVLVPLSGVDCNVRLSRIAAVGSGSRPAARRNKTRMLPRGPPWAMLSKTAAVSQRRVC